VALPALGRSGLAASQTLFSFLSFFLSFFLLFLSRKPQSRTETGCQAARPNRIDRQARCGTTSLTDPPPSQGVDFRDQEAVLQRCSEWATPGMYTDPLFPGAYGGADAHPLELVFFKTNRGVQEEALAVHTRAALANAPWAVPAALLCGA
jgi:hypothetical protein